MTAYALTAAAPAAPRPKLALIVLIVLAVHALLLFGLPRWARTVLSPGGPPVFQIRTIAPAQPQPAAQTAPAPRPPRHKPKPHPKPSPAPPAADQPLPFTDSPPVADTTSSLLSPPSRAAFGGNAPLPAIVSPLPPDHVPAVIEQLAAQPGPAAPDTRTPGAPDPPKPVQLPRPAEIVYQATVTQSGRRVALPSTINWRHDGLLYELRWVLYGPAIGDHSRSVTGLVTAHGLAPVTAKAMGSDGYNLTFDYAQSRLRGESPPDAPASDAASAASAASAAGETPGAVPLPPGAQDPFSLLIQLGALVAGNPSQYPVGTRISLPVASSSDQAPQPASFTIADDSDFAAAATAGQFAGRSLPALHLVHESAGGRDPRIELWLGKRLDYLPLRMLFIQPDGDQIDMTLQSAHTQTVPPSLPAAAASSAGSERGGEGDSGDTP